jgi:hypothetical protein
MIIEYLSTTSSLLVAYKQLLFSMRPLALTLEKVNYPVLDILFSWVISTLNAGLLRSNIVMSGLASPIKICDNQLLTGSGSAWKAVSE